MPPRNIAVMPTLSTGLLPVMALLVCLAAGCASSRTPMGGQFVFHVDGAEYVILSFRESSGAGGNYLIRRDQGRIVLRAADLDQDGVIEAVLVGNLDLAEANRLYSAGLALARAGGKVDDREAPRIFTLSAREQILTLRSVVAGPRAPFNSLTVTDASGRVVAVGVDEGADGVIDRVIEGDLPVSVLQGLLVEMIAQGLLLGRVERVDGGVHVLPRIEP